MNTTNRGTDIDIPVLIVGAGPVGQLAALMLSRQGIASIVVERLEHRSTAPKAHALNPRTLEICAGLDLPMAEIYRQAAPREQGGWVQFMSSLSGVSFGVIPYERQDDAVLELTPYPLANIAQPRFEEILASAIDDCADIQVIRGCCCEGLRETPAGIEATVSMSVADTRSTIRAQYVLAADGAGSRLRDMLGIEMDGPEALQRFMMIHFRADLSEQVQQRPGILYFLFDPDISAALIAYDQENNWVLMHGCDEAGHDSASFDDATCRHLVENAVGGAVADIEVCNVSPWVMSSQVAREYGRGRVFLIGDAAHRFPPTGGMGLNTGAADAQNICWKIAAVLKGAAGAQLLDTYQAERKPVAEINSAQSLANAAKIFDIYGVLYGPDPSKQRQYFDNYCEHLLDSEELKAAIEIQRPHFDSLRLQLGYSYAADADSVAQDMEKSISDFVPACVPGVRLPHSWVLKDGKKVSLLDLLPIDGFSLLVRSGQGPWEQALAEQDQPVCCLLEGRDFSGLQTPWGEQEMLEDVAALLIRPDGHIAHSFAQEMTADTLILKQALAEQLCKLN
jgi:2,4-dichlorophenol 6-monooxygenase